MGLQVAFAWSDECATELEKLGFEKREIYIKRAPTAFPVPEGATHAEHEKRLGDKEFFAMNRPPFQFVTTSFWGGGPG